MDAPQIVVLVVMAAVCAAAAVASFVLPARRRRRAERELPCTSPSPPAAPITDRRGDHESDTPAPVDPGEAYPLDQIDLWGHWRGVMELRQAGHRRSLEQVAADLRRIRAVLPYDEDCSAVHQFGHRIAYDQLLVEACMMLDLPHGLGDDMAGPDRELERLRAEAMLEYAGITIVRPIERSR